jgi:hypothetical protein
MICILVVYTYISIDRWMDVDADKVIHIRLPVLPYPPSLLTVVRMPPVEYAPQRYGLSPATVSPAHSGRLSARAQSAHSTVYSADATTMPRAGYQPQDHQQSYPLPLEAPTQIMTARLTTHPAAAQPITPRQPTSHQIRNGARTQSNASQGR